MGVEWEAPEKEGVDTGTKTGSSNSWWVLMAFWYSGRNKHLTKKMASEAEEETVCNLQ